MKDKPFEYGDGHNDSEEPVVSHTMSDQTTELIEQRDYFHGEMVKVQELADNRQDEIATLTARCEALETELEHQKAETTRAVLRYTVKGYMAGENADSKHWRERAEAAEKRREALETPWIGWSPTADNVNALPAAVRSYVHELETRCDPSGELRELVIARDTCHALDVRCEALTAERDKQKAENEELKGRIANALPMTQKSPCEWPGCTEPSLCSSRNFGNRLVCRRHFRITNGPEWDEVGPIFARCQRLEQSMKDVIQRWNALAAKTAQIAVDGPITQRGVMLERAGGIRYCSDDLSAALASLLPTQEGNQ